MLYLVVVAEKTRWYMDPDFFTVELFKRWPDAKIRPLVSLTHSFEWKVQVDDDIVISEFNREGRSFAFFVGSTEACAKVALWIRSLVPPEQDLLFMVDTGSWMMPLRPDTTLEDILNHHE